MNIPVRDAFSFTAAGHHWVNHAWLFSLIVYGIESIGGHPAVNALKCLILAAAFLTAFVTAVKKGASPRLAALSCIFSAIVIRSRFTERPQIFSLLFTAIFLQCIAAPRTGSHRRLWLFPLIMVLWANLHAACVMGVFIFGVALVAIPLTRFLGPSLPLKETYAAPPNMAYLALILLAVIAAMFVNPNGYHLPLYGLEVTQHLGALTPREWSSMGGIHEFPLFWLYASVLCLTLLMSIRRADVFDYCCQGLFLIFAYKYMRNMEFFAIASPAVLAVQINRTELQPFLHRRFRKFTETWRDLACLLSAGGLLWGAFFSVFRESPRFFRFGTGINAELFPMKEIPEFLNKYHVTGHGYNDIFYGGFMMWSWPQQPTVFLDGRLEVYREVRTEIEQGKIAEMLQHYDIQYAVVDNSWGVNPTRDYLLADLQNWALVFYRDYQMLFLKRSMQNAAAITENEISYYRLNYMFGELPPAEIPLAIAEIKRLEKLQPNVFYHRIALGVLLAMQGDAKSAEESFMQALTIDPNLPRAYYSLSDLCLRMNRPDPAIAYAKQGLWRDKSVLPLPYFLLGSAMEEKSNFIEASVYFRHAVKISPSFFPAWASLIRDYEASGNLQAARQARRAAESVGKNENQRRLSKPE